MHTIYCHACDRGYPDEECAAIGRWPYKRAFAQGFMCLSCLDRVPASARRAVPVDGDLVFSRHARAPRVPGRPMWVLDSSDILFAVAPAAVDPAVLAMLPRSS